MIKINSSCEISSILRDAVLSYPGRNSVDYFPPRGQFAYARLRWGIVPGPGMRRRLIQDDIRKGEEAMNHLDNKFMYFGITGKWKRGKR